MSSRHDDLRDRIAQTFREKGYDVKTEVQVGHKRIDLVAVDNKEVLLVEVVDKHYSEPVDEQNVDIEQVVIRVKPPPEPEKPEPKGTLVVKYVKCGKNCGKCPHGPYVYRVHHKGGKLVWTYLGPAREVRPESPDARSKKGSQFKLR